MLPSRVLILGAAGVAVGVAVLTGDPAAAGVPASTSAAAPALAATAATAATTAATVYARMTQAQRIGQLFMVGGAATGPGSATATAISTYHVGNLILTGRTTAGPNPVRAVASRMDALTTSAATAAVPLFLAADQEGGAVQVLQGSGFSRLPSALVQAQVSDATLTSNAKHWGLQVAQAGVDTNLAPVMDTVPVGVSNPPIGFYDREYGHTPAVVAAKGSAFLRGMRSAGLAMTAKHFPGLGHVAANTDTTANVKDTVTTRTSPDIGPFRSAVAAGARMVMVSTAIYTRIDAARPAVFSPTVITGMIRGDLAFSGVVISDDLGSAKQVQAWTPGTRAVDFIGAGGDIVLTVDPAVLPAMVSAVTARAASNATFRAQVAAAVMRVLTAKAAEGLLGTRPAADGSLGPVTISALQRALGVPVTAKLDAVTVRALQTRVGTTADGVWGPASMAALQTYLGASRDGARTWNARTVTLLQRYLVTQL